MKAINDLETVVDVKVTTTWKEVNEKIELRKQELKALNALKKGFSNGQVTDPTIKLQNLKDKWFQSCPLGSKLLGCDVTFKAFGSDEEMFGRCFSIVLDKRVNMYLMKIQSNGKVYHKDSKCINSTLFMYENNELVLI